MYPVQTYKRCAKGGRPPTTVHNNDPPEGFQSTSIHFLPKGLTFKQFWAGTKRLATNIFCDVLHLRVEGKKSAGYLPPLHEPQHFYIQDECSG